MQHAGWALWSAPREASLVHELLKETLINPLRGLISALVLRGPFSIFFVSSCTSMCMGRPWPRGSPEKSDFSELPE